jgi:hypothetical protein
MGNGRIILKFICAVRQQMHCSDSLLVSYRTEAGTILAPHHRCIYCHPDKAQILTRQCNQCYSDFTIGILKILLTVTAGCTDPLTYIIQPYAP